MMTHVDQTREWSFRLWTERDMEGDQIPMILFDNPVPPEIHHALDELIGFLFLVVLDHRTFEPPPQLMERVCEVTGRPYYWDGHTDSQVACLWCTMAFRRIL